MLAIVGTQYFIVYQISSCFSIFLFLAISNLHLTFSFKINVFVLYIYIYIYNIRAYFYGHKIY